jgi:cyclopropane fatty-acyl-phospholipid synthase-like methyltransferase
MTYTNRDIADYYNQTLVHYKKWWKLDKVLAVHYGMWEKQTKSFQEALINTNRKLASIAGIRKGERILDAGCGVGGSTFFLAKAFDARVTGITLSEKQLDFANNKRSGSALQNLVDFKLEDYHRTSFKKETFDLIWAVESLTSSQDKPKFCSEAIRILKPGGKLVVADYFHTGKTPDPKEWMKKWQDCWSLAEIISEKQYIDIFSDSGLTLTRNVDATANIFPSSRIMYKSYLLGAIPSVLYNTFNDTSRFARTHYLSGKYQYRALKEGFWKYKVMLFIKK